MSDSANDDRGRIVVVAAGFALWRGGRCIGAARWSDIRRLRAYRTDDALRLGIDLADGTALEFHEKAPGFDAFLDRASATLSGLLPFAQWHPALVLAAPDGEGTVLFERTGPRR
ncbi:MAG: hypothetical protein V4550_05940 [Gemmatimonadota bacterium]